MDKNSTTPKNLRQGSGVAKEEDKPEAPKVEAPPEGYQLENPSKESSKRIWHDEPSLAAQLLAYPDTCKKGPVQVLVFDLSDEKQLADYNKILEDFHPPTSPRKIAGSSELINFEGKFSMYLSYQTVQYKRLVKIKKED